MTLREGGINPNNIISSHVFEKTPGILYLIGLFFNTARTQNARSR